MLLGSILLALAWAALEGEFSLTNLVTGYLLGYVVLVLLGKGGVLPAGFGSRVKHAIGLASFFLWQLVLANLRIAVDVLRPGVRIRPAVVAIPLDVKSDAGIVGLSTLINLTPGSVTVDLSDDRRTLYVHVMHMHTREETVRDIKEGFERRVLLLFD